MFDLSLLFFLPVHCADYLKADGQSRAVLGQAVEVSSWFLSHSVPYARLRQKQLSMAQYNGKTVALALPGKTRWGSYYNSVHQLLKAQFSLQSLVLDQYDFLVECAGAKSDAKRRARLVLDTVRDSNFWTALEEVRRHLGPILVRVML